MSTDTTAGLEVLSRRLGYDFADQSLLRRALAHRSWCAEYGGEPSNERLEFLGDAVLRLVVSSLLFDRLGDSDEGDLTRVRAHLVREDSLYRAALQLGLPESLRLGEGEARGGGALRSSILADALEALIAAVFLDGGLEAASCFVLDRFGMRIAEAAIGPGGRDYKTRLQELAAARTLGRPRYVVRDEGPDHAKRFFATVLLDSIASGTGEGNSKKEAEQAAAWSAWSELQEGGQGAGAT